MSHSSNKASIVEGLQQKGIWELTSYKQYQSAGTCMKIDTQDETIG